MHEFGMSKQETLEMRYGEMVDMISCLSIYNGSAKEKRKLTYDEVMSLR